MTTGRAWLGKAQPQGGRGVQLQQESGGTAAVPVAAAHVAGLTAGTTSEQALGDTVTAVDAALELPRALAEPAAADAT